MKQSLQKSLRAALHLNISLVAASFMTTLGVSFLLSYHQDVLAFPGQEDNFFERGNEQFEQIVEQFQSTQPDAVLSIEGTDQPDEQPRWQPLFSTEGGFSVWAPLGLISHESESVPFGSDTLEVEILSSLSTYGNFFAAHTQIPSGTEASELFESVKETLVSETAFSLNGTTDVSADGYTAESFMLTGDNSYLLGFSLVGEINGTERLYVVGIRQDGQTSPSEQAQQFLNSFELTSE
ncbi:MAG: hypothetical protein AAFQ63_19440 [Cyanobacteria bacterium J06621_11]